MRGERPPVVPVVPAGGNHAFGDRHALMPHGPHLLGPILTILHAHVLAGTDEYLLNVIYCCVIMSIRVPVSMPRQAVARLCLEVCHYMFLETMNQRHGYGILTLPRVGCRFTLAMTVSMLTELSR